MPSEISLMVSTEGLIGIEKLVDFGKKFAKEKGITEKDVLEDE